MPTSVDAAPPSPCPTALYGWRGPGCRPPTGSCCQGARDRGPPCTHTSPGKGQRRTPTTVPSSCSQVRLTACSLRLPRAGAGAGGAADSHLLLPAPPAPPSPGLHAPQPESLLQAEYRLWNGSDRECVSPTAKVSKKEALKVGLGPGRAAGLICWMKGCPGQCGQPPPPACRGEGGGRHPSPPTPPGPVLVRQLDARDGSPGEGPVRGLLC